MTSLLAAVSDLVLPVRCVGCGRNGAALCDSCRPGPPTVRIRHLRGGLQVTAAGRYDGGLRQALLAWKERGHGALAGPLSCALELAVRTSVHATPPPGRGVLLVPVPTPRSSRRDRGGDLLARLTCRAGRRAGLRTALGALSVDPRVRDSAGLDRQERMDNLRGAFRARPGPRDVPAVLVDDIVTTGTTLREAAGALSGAGWSVLGAAVVADTPLE